MLVDLAQPTWEEVRAAFLTRDRVKRQIVAATKFLGAIVLLIGIASAALILVEQRQRRRERIWFFTAFAAPPSTGRPADWVPYLEAYTQAIGRHATALRPCLARTATPREDDKVVMMRFTIDPEGSVNALEPAGTDLDPSCARAALQELRFEPPPGGAPIQVRCPYHLEPGEAGEPEVSTPRSWTQEMR